MSAGLDLLAATAALVDIASVSHDEAAITAHIEGRLRAVPWLEVTRIDHNLVARTNFGRAQRLILAGHTDTVPVNGNLPVVRVGDELVGRGTVDMKAGVAVALKLAAELTAPTVDVTWIWYDHEEVASSLNGLGRLARNRADLLEADFAILGEPTGATVEGGCNGTARL